MISLLFAISGACGLIYQIVWLRLAAANFGVTAIVASIVLSTFMAGLSLGGWLGARLAGVHEGRGARHFTFLYATAEVFIGASGLLVAPLLGFGGSLLTDAGLEWDSPRFYWASGAWIVLVLLPFTTCMGTTLPLALAAFGPAKPGLSRFADLYFANVAGALIGVVASALVLVEAFGFSGALRVAATLNFVVAAAAVAYAFVRRDELVPMADAASAEPIRATQPESRNGLLALLFISGAASLGMEVVWLRQFAPLLGTLVYSFAALLVAYLSGTAFGAHRYRRRRAALRGAPGDTIAAAAVLAGACALLPSLAVDPRIASLFEQGGYSLQIGANVAVVASVGVFAAVTGFLTPLLVDVWSDGSPSRVGRAYAFNALGCVVGPLIASFILLPSVGEHGSLNLLAAPFLLLGLAFVPGRQGTEPQQAWRATWLAALAAAGLLAAFTRDYSSEYPSPQVRRDFAATTVATGQGMTRELLVNGIGMTSLTTDTKMMVHLPLASQGRAPKTILVLCFGMGTSFRSAMSWGADVDVVELVPGVPSLFGYFHEDAEAIAASPRAHIHIDDARRFLRRTRRTYDLIVIDPPPPVGAATSSLLYSREFYQLARARLAQGGLLQQWMPYADATTTAAVAQSIAESFPQARVFRSVEGWGLHFVASERPIGPLDARALADHMPPLAAKDFAEWTPGIEARDEFQALLNQETSIDKLLAGDPHAPALTDDRPVNEYFLLRELAGLRR